MSRSETVGEATALIPPRLLTKAQVIAYAAGGSPQRFERWRQLGMMPPRVPGTMLYDRVDVDQAIDRLKKLEAAASDGPQGAELSPLEKWKQERERDGRKHSRG